MSDLDVAHPVKHYETLITSMGKLPPYLKRFAIRRGIKDLLGMGRVPLSCHYNEAINPVSGFAVGSFVFDTVYLGRKAVLKRAVRHRLRKEIKASLGKGVIYDRSR